MAKLDTTRLKSYVHFVGSARSGHTLIAQMINAHPDAVIGNEVKDYRMFRSGHTRKNLFNAIYNNTVEFAENGSLWPPHNPVSYKINDNQGTTNKPVIIGDKFGPTAKNVYKSLTEYKRWIGLPIKFIHVIRDPYDNILSMGRMNGLSFQDNEEKFFKQQQWANKFDAYKVYLSAFKDDAFKELWWLFSFLGLLTDEKIIKDCIKIWRP